MGAVQGCNERGKREQFLGRRIAAEGSEKSQQCHIYFLHHSYLLPKDLKFEHGGVKLASCSGRHLTSLRPWASVGLCTTFSVTHLASLHHPPRCLRSTVHARKRPLPDLKMNLCRFVAMVLLRNEDEQ